MGERIAVLQTGVLQQVGTPEELYTNPVNMFVAGFIGSPAMNFLPAEAAAGVARTGEVVGFRPEHVVVGDGAGGGLHLEATAEVVEYLGDEELVHFSVGDETLLAKLPVEQRLASGDAVTLGVPAGKLHRFDAATGEAVGR